MKTNGDMDRFGRKNSKKRLLIALFSSRGSRGDAPSRINIAKNIVCLGILFITPAILLINLNVMAVAPVTFLGTALYLFTFIFLVLCGASPNAEEFAVTQENDCKDAKSANRMLAAKAAARASYYLSTIYLGVVTVLVVWVWAFILRYRFGGEEVNFDFEGGHLEASEIPGLF